MAGHSRSKNGVLSKRLCPGHPRLAFRRLKKDVDARDKRGHDELQGSRKTRMKAKRSNMFADLGLPNPEQELLKAQLTLQIYKIVKARGLTQTQAGHLLGIKQPHVSALMRNRAGNFSVGRLFEFLNRLGQDVKITVKPTRKGQGEMEVVVG
jgi:predicted XRE-type DNA-binding protein